MLFIFLFYPLATCNMFFSIVRQNSIANKSTNSVREFNLNYIRGIYDITA